MSEFRISQVLRQNEIERAMERNLKRDRLFVLLLGPSAIGKSTIINEMNTQSREQKFEYVKPTMTRPNRLDETDKLSVSNAIFDELEISGEFVVVNRLYGVRYGTPLRGVLDPLQRGNTPILDYPLETVNALERPEYDILSFYVYPRSIEEWQLRIEHSGRNVADRLEAGKRELGSLAINGLIHPRIDVSIINPEGAANQAAKNILETIDQVTS